MTKPLYGLVVCALSFALCSKVYADETSAKDRASQAFDAGVKALESSDWVEAARQFEVAYNLVPNASALFNWGQSLAFLGKPVEAEKLLREYLQTTETISVERRTRVEALLAAQRRRIGWLQLKCKTQNVELYVDGKLLGRTPLAEPIALADGQHGLVAKHPDYELLATSVEIRPRVKEEREIELAPLAREPASSAPGKNFELLAKVQPAEAVVWVDGYRYDQRPLLAGRHRVEVKSQGYVTWQGHVDVVSNVQPLLIVSLPALQPRASHSIRNGWIWGAGISGAVLGATALSLRIWNNDRYSQWRRDRVTVDEKLASSAEDAASRKSRLELYDRAANIQAMDDVVLSATLLATSALVSAGVAILTN